MCLCHKSPTDPSAAFQPFSFTFSSSTFWHTFLCGLCCFLHLKTKWIIVQVVYTVPHLPLHLTSGYASLLNDNLSLGFVTPNRANWQTRNRFEAAYETFCRHFPRLSPDEGCPFCCSYKTTNWYRFYSCCCTTCSPSLSLSPCPTRVAGVKPIVLGFRLPLQTILCCNN